MDAPSALFVGQISKVKISTTVEKSEGNMKKVTEIVWDLAAPVAE